MIKGILFKIKITNDIVENFEQQFCNENAI